MQHTTIARPYAKAVFEFALAHNELAKWSRLLETLALIVEHTDVQAFIAHPKTSAKEHFDLLQGCMSERLDATATNFIHLLADNKRLAVLPDIAARYAYLRAEHEQVVDAEVVSFAPLNDIQKAKIEKQVKQRLKRDVRLSCRVDTSILGGAIIRAGDLVIDGTVKSKLNRLYQSLIA